LGWAPSIALKDGLGRTFKWIDAQISKEEKSGKDITEYAVSHVVQNKTPEDPSGQ